MAQRGFEILEHPADVGFRAFADSLPELFGNAALAMLSIGTDLSEVRPVRKYRLGAESSDLESLMVDWLNEVLYWFDGTRVVFGEFRVEAGETWVRAAALGEPRDPGRHAARLVIKAATYHQLKVERRDGLWVAEVYLDV